MPGNLMRGFNAGCTAADGRRQWPFLAPLLQELTLRLSGTPKRDRSSRLFAQLLDLVHQPSYHAQVDNHLRDPFRHEDFNSARIGLIELGKLLVWRMHNEE